MDFGVVPDVPLLEPEARADGRAWCLRCAGEISYRVENVEFLGNPVRSTCFCLRCGNRVHPGAMDGRTARRKRSESRWTRMGAAVVFALIILLPVLLVAAILALIWRML